MEDNNDSVKNNKKKIIGPVIVLTAAIVGFVVFMSLGIQSITQNFG